MDLLYVRLWTNFMSAFFHLENKLLISELNFRFALNFINIICIKSKQIFNIYKTYLYLTGPFRKLGVPF